MRKKCSWWETLTCVFPGNGAIRSSHWLIAQFRLEFPEKSPRNLLYCWLIPCQKWRLSQTGKPLNWSVFLDSALWLQNTFWRRNETQWNKLNTNIFIPFSFKMVQWLAEWLTLANLANLPAFIIAHAHTHTHKHTHTHTHSQTHSFSQTHTHTNTPQIKRIVKN